MRVTKSRYDVLIEPDAKWSVVFREEIVMDIHMDDIGSGHATNQDAARLRAERLIKDHKAMRAEKKRLADERESKTIRYSIDGSL